MVSPGWSLTTNTHSLTPLLKTDSQHVADPPNPVYHTSTLQWYPVWTPVVDLCSTHTHDVMMYSIIIWVVYER